MKKAFYITAFNSPQEAGRSMAQFGPIFPDSEKFLSNQSTPEHLPKYEELCRLHGFTHLTWENKGATAAKRKIVEHAFHNGFEIMSQISEDFELNPPSKTHPAVVNGREFFLHDSEALLKVPDIHFVHWTYFRHGIHRGYFWSAVRGPKVRYRREDGVTLSYLEGEVSLFNWPYTGKVKQLMDIWNRSSSVIPQTTQEEQDNLWSGGEWALTQVSIGRGVCLVAHPVRHTDREVKPEGSLG